MTRNSIVLPKSIAMNSISAQINKSNGFIKIQFSGMKKSLLFLLLFVSTVFSVNATVYYWNGGTFNNVSSWTTVRAGGGSTPANFTTSGDIFILQGTGATTNGVGSGASDQSMSVTALWTFAAGTTLEIEGGATMTATALIGSLGTFLVNNGGTYIHNAIGTGTNGLAADFPSGTNAVFGASSTVEFQRWATAASTAPVSLPTIASPGWGNLRINIPTFGGSWNQTAGLTSIQGNLDIISTGGTTREFRLVANTTVFTVAIGGNLNVSGGIFAPTSGSGKPTLNIAGDVNISGSGYLRTSQSSSGELYLNVNGTLGGSTGKLSIAGTGQFASTSRGFVIVTLKGNLDVTSSSSTAFVFQTSSSSGKTYTLNIGGNFNWTGTGTFIGGSTASIASINFTGGGTNSAYIRTAGTQTFTFTNWSVANSPSGKTLTLNNNLTNAASRTMTVASGATLATTGNYTNSGTTTINGSFQINQGGFASGGTWTYGAGATLVYNHTSGTYGAIDAGHTYWPSASGPTNVTVANSSSGGINMGVSRTVSGTFQTAAGVQGTALTLNGINQINAGGFFSTTPVYGGSSTLIYNSGSTYGRGSELTTGTGIPSNITVNSGSGLNYGNGATGTARTITGNLLVDGGFFMDFGASDMTQALTVNGDVTINGTLSLSDAAGGDIKVGGNWTNAGTFNPKSRAVFFVNSTNSLISGTGGAIFDFVIVDKTGGAAATLASNATINNTLTLTAGNLAIASNTLTLSAAVSRTAGFLAGGNTSNLIIGGTAGSLHFDNAGTNNYLKGFTINTGASATLANALNITDYDGVGAEGVLTVAGTGVLTTGGFLAIKSSANGTGRIAANTTSTTYISGNVSVERFIPQNSSKGWRLLASNTTGQSINAAWQEGQNNSLNDPNPGFGTQISAGNALGLSLGAAQTAGFDTLSAGVSLFKYNPATDGLEPVANTISTGLASEPGYFIFIRGDRRVGGYGAGAPTAATVLRSQGAVFMGNFTTATGSQNYGLVRNPFASRIDMRGFTVGANLNDAFQVWDAKLGGAFGVGGFQTFFRSGADYLVTPGGGSYGANGSVQNFIESGAAFYIQSVSNTNNDVVVPESSKAAASSTSSFRPVTPLAGESRLSFNLYANNTGGSVDLVDGGLAYFANEYNNTVDVQDVKKSLNFNENFGMKRANTDLVLERRQPINLNDTIFFHMTSVRRISYRLDIEATNMDPLITTAVLKDNYTNTNTTLDLTNVNAYTFTVDANAASRSADRFSIVFRQSGVVPVSFVSVKAAQAGNKIAVEWKVANEVNTVRYEIEKSTDGRSFSKKGMILATGANTYNWLDENTVNGYNYYRIRSVDNNGQVKYTEVVKVQIGGKAGISISPNPVQGNFVNILINQSLAGKYGIRLTNIAGQAVYNREVTHNGGSSSQSFVLPSALSNGVYQLEVIAPDNTRQVEKLIIQGN